MGQDFRALASHNLSVDELERLPTKLDEVTDRLYQDLFDLGLNVRWEVPPPATGLRCLAKTFLGDSSAEVVKIDMPIHWHYSGYAGGDFEEYLKTSWTQDGAATVTATAALWIAVAPQCVEIGSWVRWFEFLSQPAARLTLRKLCKEILNVLNVANAEVIYVPDNAWPPGEIAANHVFEGESYATAKAQLMKLAEPPKPNIVSLFESATTATGMLSRSEADTYYIDRFVGLT